MLHRPSLAQSASLIVGVSIALALTGCNDSQKAAPTAPKSAAMPKAVTPNGEVDPDNPAAKATPMPERVGVLSLLNKRNGLTQEIKLNPGEYVRLGRVTVHLRACERTAQWETVPEVGAFVQLDVLDTAGEKWTRAFSGWLFRERPERNVVQHPIYDVYVKDCEMKWPNEGDLPMPFATVAAPEADPVVSANAPSSAPQTPASVPAAASNKPTPPAAKSPTAPTGKVTEPASPSSPAEKAPPAKAAEAPAAKAPPAKSSAPAAKSDNKPTTEPTD